MDRDRIDALITLGRSASSILRMQGIAKGAMARSGLGRTLHNACAATLSAFLENAGINVPMTLGAGNLGRRIKNRGWTRVPVGQQIAGDVGVAKDTGPPAGADHIYLVVERINSDKMLIADNQAPNPHIRFASGGGK